MKLQKPQPIKNTSSKPGAHSTMSTRNRIPAAIEPLLRLPPEASLTILTGTLGCSPAWLTSRFVGSALSDRNDRTFSVVFVSWMRDLTFWKSEVRRAMVCKTVLFTNNRFCPNGSRPLISRRLSTISEWCSSTACLSIRRLIETSHFLHWTKLSQKLSASLQCRSMEARSFW